MCLLSIGCIIDAGALVVISLEWLARLVSAPYHLTTVSASSVFFAIRPFSRLDIRDVQAVLRLFSVMSSKSIFLTGWLGTTALFALTIQSFLGLFVGLLAPIFLFDNWAHEICYRHFELSTIQWYTPLWEERYGMYQRWRPIVAIVLLSAFYLFAFFPFALPDRLWRRPRLKWIWTGLMILLGVTLALYGLIKYSPLNFPVQN